MKKAFIHTSFEVGDGSALDDRHNRFASTAEAIANILEEDRYLGLTITVAVDGSTTEYWWKDLLTDDGLILKTGEPGAPGADSTVPGPAGPGLPAGGTANQIPEKIDATDFNIRWVDKPTVGGGGSLYAVASGINTYDAAVTGSTAYVAGLKIDVLFSNANTAAATLNLNAQGAKSIVKQTGTTFGNLVAGDINTSQVWGLLYDGTNFQIIANSKAIDAELQTTNPSNDSRYISPLKFGNWWTWMKTQIVYISGSWGFAKGGFGTSTFNDAYISILGSSAALASMVFRLGVTYTGTTPGAVWMETTNKRLRMLRDTADDLLFSANNFLFKSGNTLSGLVVNSAGDVSYLESTNLVSGTATLSASAVSISNSAVLSTSLILVTVRSAGINNGRIRVSAQSTGSFTISSSDAGDTCEVAYLIMNP